MEKSANAFVFKNPITGQDVSSSKGSWFKNNFTKIIITILVIGVLVEIVYGAFTLFAPATYQQQLNPLQPKANELQDASLSLVSDKTVYKVNDEVEVDVQLFTGGYTTTSTDLVVKYDPAFLKPRDKDFGVAGNIYSEYPAIEVDDSQGAIGISGITLPDKGGFMGVGSFATLYFKALNEGQTQVSIEFQPQATADSNVVLSGSTKDILGKVTNTEITISSTQVASNSDNGQKCQGFTQHCQETNGIVGIQSCIGGSLINGACDYDPKYTTSCDICKTN